jgi:nicotinamide mononucleotide transporter
MGPVTAALRELLTHWPEAIAVVSGIVYVLLILWRNRWGWVAGALSSSIYVALMARARLPMQSILQAYYVAMSVYGWYSWKRNAEQEEGHIHHWPLRRHFPVGLIVLVATLLSARWLAAETRAAWPLLDSLATYISFMATWLLARSVLENWYYWIVADTIMVGLFIQQRLYFTVALFVVYIVVSVCGLRSWRARYRRQQSGQEIGA